MRTIRSEFSKKTCEETRADSWDPFQDDYCCNYCELPLGGQRPEYHHHTPAALGGDNSRSNCRHICKKCHRQVTTEEDLPRITKAKSIEEKRAGLRRSKHKIQSRGFERKRANG